MNEYALVGPQGEVKTYSRAVNPNVGTKPGWRWLPVERAAGDFDPATETRGDEIVRVEASMVTVEREIRPKTADEIRQQTDADLEQRLPLALAAVFADLDNRLRAIERKAPRTPEEFRRDVIGTPR